MRNILLAILTFFTLTSCNAKSKDVITLSKDNTLVLNTEVDGSSVSKLMLQAALLDENLPDGEAIYLVLNTPGGSIVDGMELIQNLKALGRPIHTITLFAASMGFQIAQGLNDRLILQTGELMSHPASTGGGGFGGQFGGNEPSQLTNRYNSWLQKINELDMLTVKRTKGKQTLESYKKSYDNELWISGQKAVDAGYADKVVQAKCDKELNSGSVSQQFSFFGMTINVTFSTCPLITGPLDVALMIKTNGGKTISLSEFKKQGGQFGQICVIANQNKSSILCPEDYSLTLEKVEQTKQEVMNKITAKDKSVKKSY